MNEAEFKAEAARKVDAWIVELEKGDIKPAKEILSDKEGKRMCCLGVYLHTLGRARNGAIFYDGGYAVVSFPNASTMEEIGLTKHGGPLYGKFAWPDNVSRAGIGKWEGFTADNLSQLNDWTGIQTFEPIVKVLKLNRQKLIDDAWHWADTHK